MYKQDDIMYKNTIAKEIWDRDKQVNTILEKNGYKVLRFWERDINNNLEECVGKILRGHYETTRSFRV